MKISNILTLVVISLFIASCAKKTTPLQKQEIVETDQLTQLKQQSEHNNPFVVNAKNQLLQFIGSKNFDSYITKHGILKCQSDKNQSSCVLNFYLNEYYKLKSDLQMKKMIAENQIELNKIEVTEDNIKNYCQRSADFVTAIYAPKEATKSRSYYQQLFKLDEQDMTTLYAKIAKDSYTHFLLNENPTIIQDIKTEYISKCLIDPTTNIINYSTIFR